MFIDKIEEEYGKNKPIFAEEILDLFGDYSRAYIFRMIKKAEEEEQLVSYSRGVYYIPKKTFFGRSTICCEMVAEKKYLRNKGTVYGIYGGINLLNQFGITTQVPNTIEIITNKETTRKRRVKIENQEFILRAARCEITNNNYPEYTLLQIFNDLDENDRLNDFAKEQISGYIKDNNVTVEKLFSMSKSFPPKTLKKMIGSEVIYGIV